ncbi:hypothetical protein SAMN06309944_2429, partial [Micrococcales bacterium KH10]
KGHEQQYETKTGLKNQHPPHNKAEQTLDQTKQSTKPPHNTTPTTTAETAPQDSPANQMASTIKHTIEFSNNHHTPLPANFLARSGATSLTYTPINSQSNHLTASFSRSQSATISILADWF